MKFLRRLMLGFGKKNLDAEMAEEMRLHLEMQAERNRAAGMNAEEAVYAAQRQFGNSAQLQQQVRESRWTAWWDHVARDCRHAFRTLVKSPMLSGVIMLSLGIGIGANTVIFSWIRGVVFRPMPGVENATRFLLVEPRAETGSYPGASWLEYQDLREQLPAFGELFAFRMLPLNCGEPGHEERAYAQLVSGNYFTALGLRPAAGRLLRPGEVTKPGAEPVVVISHDFWQAHLASDPDVVGRTIKLNGRPLTVVGITPAGFEGTMVGLNFDCWIPATMAPVLLGGSNELQQRDSRGYSVMGTLAAGATRAQAQTEFTSAMQELTKTQPATNAGMAGEIMSFWQAPRGAQRFLLTSLAVLQGFMLLVLLVVCANAANLLLARATARRREIGVRLSLGARPGQILRLFLVESLMLGLLASVLGFVLALWGTNAVRAVPLPGGFPFKFQTNLEVDGFLFTLLLGVGCALVFGLLPAVQSARIDSQLALRSKGLPAGKRGSRNVLVALEVALALLALVTAGMFLRNILETRVDPGFRTSGVLLASYDLTGAGYDKPRALATLDDLLKRLAATPGVEGAAIASWVPLDFHGMPQGGFKLAGHERADGGLDRALTYTVTPGYFKLLGLTFADGHDFAALTDTKAPPQVVVNEEFVRRFVGGGSALGLQLGGKSSFEIVGVVRNALYETFGEPAKPMMYFSYRDRYSPIGQVHVRASGPESSLAPNLRRIVHDLNPAVALFDVRTLNEHVDKNLFFRKIPARLFTVLGPLILLLAAIGIYAVVAYSVTLRTTEIGVRLALGASHRQVIRQIVRETIRVVCLGAFPAWLLAVVVMLHLRGGVLNAPILFGVPLLLLGVAWLAAWLPARRAARVDPVIALRAE